jgi:hypothetical protein
MKTLLVKHPKTYFGFRKDKMFCKGSFKTVLALSLGKHRLFLLN